jgi:galactokinase
MALEKYDEQVILKLKELANQANIDVSGAKVHRSSSRFCFGVEHGDYNGTELFGVGTDRFIWLA